MSSQRLIIVCVLSLVFFSCRKNTIPEELIVAPPAPAQIAVTFKESQILRVPGNYQQWQVPLAPKIVSVNGDGEYEGFVNFTLEDTQFWLVKGTAWDNVLPYNETGNQTFGHNGTFFKLPSGATLRQRPH